MWGRDWGSEMRTIDIRLFGAFRMFSQSSTIRLSIGKNALVADLRGLLIDELSKRFERQKVADLVAASVFANEESVVWDQSPIADHKELAMLPPVCGG